MTKEIKRKCGNTISMKTGSSFFLDVYGAANEKPQKEAQIEEQLRKLHKLKAKSEYTEKRYSHPSQNS